jgi:MFS family permease
MKRSVRWYDYITVNIYWFALTTRSQVLAPLIIPLLVQQFVGEEAKGTYVGQMRLWALMFALLVQALMGLLSDRSTLRWGRRRPFIVVGTLLQVVVLAGIGFVAGLEGMTGYWTLFLFYMASMLASDTAHAATQGLIPDLVPEDRRGAFSGVKTLFELPLPLIFVSFVLGRMLAAGSLWAALVAVMLVLVVCMAITLFVREKPLKEPPFDIDWKPFLRLLGMVAAFTAIILVVGAGVKWVMGLDLDLPPGSARLLIGVAGVVGMVVAIGLGVLLSIRISIGPEIRKYPSFPWWVISRLAFLVPATNLAAFLLFFLQERFPDLAREKAAGPAATAVMFVGIFILLTALPAGWLSDRVGKKPLVALAGILGAAGTLIVVIVPQMAGIYVGASMVGAAAGLFYSSAWALGTDLVPQEQAGRYLGVSNLAGAGAGAVGAYIGGPIADNQGYVLLFAIYAALFLLSVVPLLGIREPRGRAA